MRTILRIREIATDDGMDGQHIEVVRRDASGMKILDLRTRLQIDARSSGDLKPPKSAREHCRAAAPIAHHLGGAAHPKHWEPVTRV